MLSELEISQSLEVTNVLLVQLIPLGNENVLLAVMASASMACLKGI